MTPGMGTALPSPTRSSRSPVRPSLPGFYALAKQRATVVDSQILR